MASEDGYQPMMSDERVRRIRAWQDANYRSDEHSRGVTTTFMGAELVVPADVHPPQGVSDMLANAVLREVRDTDRVLDMGTGSGVNAILAASKSSNVVAVDVNPVAVRCARDNAERNGVSGRVAVRESDVFANVEGRFDLIVFDPPFRWFAPRDLRERATADENYASLTTFFREVGDHLTERGRVLVFFGTSGDLAYLQLLIREAGLESETLSTRERVRDGETVTYFAFKLTPRGSARISP
jgi:release factor glutamine methyltransferase